MTNYFALESIHRDRLQHANPAQFTVEASQSRGWFRMARSGRAVGQNPQTMSLDFASSIEVRQVITPFSIPSPPSGAPPVDPLSYLYLDVHSFSYNDQYLISTISSTNRDARFMLVRDKVLFNEIGDPVWILWSCPMEQVLRFKRDDPLVLRLFLPDGRTLPLIDSLPENPPDPKVQIVVLLSVTPYARDGDFDNQLLDYLP